jgi:hypothetical protein
MPSVREKKIKGKVQKAKGKMAAVVWRRSRNFSKGYFFLCLLPFALCLFPYLCSSPSSSVFLMDPHLT